MVTACTLRRHDAATQGSDPSTAVSWRRSVSNGLFLTSIGTGKPKESSPIGGISLRWPPSTVTGTAYDAPPTAGYASHNVPSGAIRCRRAPKLMPTRLTRSRTPRGTTVAAP